uniref:Uncharacterized protein n=1 Tax=Arundo donax TaxID=35708 RepID=A0A0A9CB15_ARUDO
MSQSTRECCFNIDSSLARNSEIRFISLLSFIVGPENTEFALMYSSLRRMVASCPRTKLNTSRLHISIAPWSCFKDECIPFRVPSPAIHESLTI